MRSTSPSGEGVGLQPARNPVTLSRYVYDELKLAIVDGRLKKGTLYPVATLAQQLNVSRTPVREALLQLCREDLVTLERSRGVRILEPGVREMREIFQMRTLLEPWAAGQAVEMTRAPERNQALLALLRAAFEGMRTAAASDDEHGFWLHDRCFHDAILKAAGNRRLAATVDRLRDTMQLRDATIRAFRERGMKDVADDHGPIVSAVEAGDSHRAYRAMLEHVTHASKRVLEHESVRQEPGEDDEDFPVLGDGREMD